MNVYFFYGVGRSRGVLLKFLQPIKHRNMWHVQTIRSLIKQEWICNINVFGSGESLTQIRIELYDDIYWEENLIIEGHSHYQKQDNFDYSTLQILFHHCDLFHLNEIIYFKKILSIPDETISFYSFQNCLNEKTKLRINFSKWLKICFENLYEKRYIFINQTMTEKKTTF